MTFKRQLSRSEHTFVCGDTNNKGIDYLVNNVKATKEEYNTFYNQPCLIKKESHFQDFGPVIPEGYATLNEITILQYLPINFSISKFLKNITSKYKRG